MDSEQISLVRRLVLATLLELGLTGAEPMSEMALLSNTQQAGRRFQCASVRAVWFPGCRCLDFFADDGRLLKAVELPSLPCAVPAQKVA